MNDVTTTILIIFLLIILNGLFSMSEMAIISARKNRLEQLAENGNKGAKTAFDLSNNPNRFLSTTQIGITLIGSIRHADALLITGAMNRKSAIRVRELYEQAPKPCLVIAIGSCACGQNFFRDSYHTVQPLDELLPPGAVSVYVPGCPPKPEAMIAGVVKALGALTKKQPAPEPKP